MGRGRLLTNLEELELLRRERNIYRSELLKVDMLLLDAPGPKFERVSEDENGVTDRVLSAHERVGWLIKELGNG